jgi:uncharacterized protein
MFGDYSVWHEGELEVQKRAGVASKAESLSGMVRDSLPESARRFLAERQFAVLGSLDSERRTWASVAVAEPGFLQVPDATTIEIKGGWAATDPLIENISHNHDAGMLVIDFATRRRLRANGRAELVDQNTIRLRIEQAFSNCPRYIQARVPTEVLSSSGSSVQRGERLSESQTAWIAKADTFFIASAHPERGVDASHRGGNPGFVHVDGNRRLMIPDYNGNSLFNTLGNIQLNPSAGLVFVDFEAGRTLQLTGRASINWDRETAKSFPGAERLVEFEVDEAVETEHGIRLAFKFESYSPHNPRAEK